MQYTIPHISEEEKNALLEVPVLITYLIADADGKLDMQEVDWAEKLLEFRATRSHYDLMHYYDAAERIFHSTFERFEKEVSEIKDQAQRSNYIADKLAAVNAIIAKLDHHFAHELVASFKSYAKQVARASGGILGLGAISPAESKWVDLHMIHHPELLK